MEKYLLCFFVSMIPLIELRGGVPIAVGMGIDFLPALLICIIGNMLPVPIIYLFARKVLEWGCDKPYIGKFFTFCIEKGEKGGQKLAEKAGKKGLFVALMLFVGIPLPGTGAWTGTLAASFLKMGFKETTFAVVLGVIMAGLIMGAASTGVLSVIGLQKVEDYLEFCKEVGKEPDKEYKGTFNIRISPELHKELALVALKNGDTLNATVEMAIKSFVMA